MRSVIGFLLVAAGCGSPQKPTTAWASCDECDRLEPSTGNPPVAYATNTTFHIGSSWDTTCSEGTYLTEGDPPGTCHPIPHDTKVVCDGVPCSVRAGENWAEVTPTAPGLVHIRAVLTAKAGHAPKELTVGKHTIERPARIAPHCTATPAANDRDTIVVVELQSQHGVLLSGGGEVSLAVAGGAPCEPLPDVDPAMDAWNKLPERRFRCPAVGALEVEAKGQDFTARNAVRCP